MKIVDSHFHWLPPVYFELLERRNAFPIAAREGKGYRYWRDDKGGSAVLGPSWIDLDHQFAELDALGHEMSVVDTMGVPATHIASLPLGEAKEVAHAVNEAMAEAQRRHPGRFFGTAVLPFQEVDTALAMLGPAVEKLGLRGVNLPTTVGEVLIDDPRFEPLWERVAALDVPVFIHAADTMFGPMLFEGHGGAVQLSVGRIFESSTAVLRLVLAGVLERHPSLKLVLFHAGGVLPALSGRLDKNAHVAGLPLPPSDYVRRIHTDTVSPHFHALAMAYDFFGEDHVFYGSDYPCWSLADAIAVAERLDLDAPRKAKLFHRNILNLMGHG